MIIQRVKKKVQKVKPPPSRNLLFFLFQYKKMKWKCYRVPDAKRQGTWHASFPVRFVPSMIRRSLELAASLLRHRSAAETRHKSHDGNLLPSLCLCLFDVWHTYTSLFYCTERKNTIYTICQAGYICGSEKLLWQIFVAGRCPLLKRQRSGQELLVMCRRGAL